MTALECVREFLITNFPRTYCDDCLSSVLNIKPRHQVQQKTGALAKVHPFHRSFGRCTRCHSDKIVIGSRTANEHIASGEEEQKAPQPVANSVSVMGNKPPHTPAEERSYESIRKKDHSLRAFLKENTLSAPIVATQWLSYLIGIKDSLGNINNEVSFVATVLIKHYLEQRFAVTDFDPGSKAQGAPGIDIEARTADGKVIIGELKTTKPYQPGFGAAQRTSILKDLKRLAKSKADYRFMFVVDSDAYKALSHSSFASQAPGVEVIDLVSQKSFVYPQTPT
jgi:hypothetical protein